MKEERLKNLKSLTLLLVDDDDSLLTQLESVMSIFFNKVLTVNNAEEALDIYDNQAIDMVITDYAMPDMDGLELCKAIRSDNFKIPLVIMSNYSDQKILLKVIPLSLAQYLLKPYDYTSIISVLLSMLDYYEIHNAKHAQISLSVSYNADLKQLSVDGKIHPLTKSEINVLELFLSNKKRIITSTDIELCLDPTEQKSAPAIKSLIYRLRKKMGKDYILNVPGYGYMLQVEQ